MRLFYFFLCNNHACSKPRPHSGSLAPHNYRTPVYIAYTGSPAIGVFFFYLVFLFLSFFCIMCFFFIFLFSSLRAPTYPKNQESIFFSMSFDLQFSDQILDFFWGVGGCLGQKPNQLGGVALFCFSALWDSESACAALVSSRGTCLFLLIIFRV